MDLARDTVPHPSRYRWPIFKRFVTALEIAVIPAVERPTGDAELVERSLGRQVRLLDDPDNLELFGCGITAYGTPSKGRGAITSILLFADFAFRPPSKRYRNLKIRYGRNVSKGCPISPPYLQLLENIVSVEN